jgi:HNH endonuclease
LRPVNKPVIKQYNADDYDVLRSFLFSLLGAYCSYCEAPISNDSQVEHKVHKSEKTGFVDFATQWRNLLISCQSCNAAKGRSPMISGSDQKSLAAYTRTLNLWVWPDSTAKMGSEAPMPGDESYQLFTFEHTAKTQIQLRDAGLVRENTVKNEPWASESRTMLWIVPNETYIRGLQSELGDAGVAILKKRVQATIQGLNLNFLNTSNPGYNDRRVVNRTAAMEAASSALRNLENILMASGTVSHPAVKLMISAIRQTLIATGFWSVWFWVFRKALDSPAHSNWSRFSSADRLQLLDALLYDYGMTGERAKASDRIFPGTDYSRLNMDAFR